MDLMNDLAHALHVTVIVELLGVPLLRQYRSELRLVLGYSGLSRKIKYSTAQRPTIGLYSKISHAS